MTEADYEDLSNRAAVFAGALARAVSAGGLPASARAVGPLVGLYVGVPGATAAPPSDYDGAAALAGNGAYPRLFHALLRRGVALAPGAYEVLFPGMSHGERGARPGRRGGGRGGGRGGRRLGGRVSRRPRCRGGQAAGVGSSSPGTRRAAATMAR